MNLESQVPSHASWGPCGTSFPEAGALAGLGAGPTSGDLGGSALALGSQPPGGRGGRPGQALRGADDPGAGRDDLQGKEAHASAQTLAALSRCDWNTASARLSFLHPPGRLAFPALFTVCMCVPLTTGRRSWRPFTCKGPLGGRHASRLYFEWRAGMAALLKAASCSQRRKLGQPQGTVQGGPSHRPGPGQAGADPAEEGASRTPAKGDSIPAQKEELPGPLELAVRSTAGTGEKQLLNPHRECVTLI